VSGGIGGVAEAGLVIAEPWIGGCRRELLDRILVWNQGHLRWILSEY
jgi:hypothetical protein